MIEYPRPGYDAIQNDIVNNFASRISKTNDNIKHIVIVGAYTGDEIYLLLKNYPNSIVTAFECYPPYFTLLSNRFKDNKRVNIYPYAISDSNGTANFYQLNTIGCGSLLEFRGEQAGSKLRQDIGLSEIITVPTFRLDYLVYDKIDLLWVDTQGVELKVLKGSPLSNIDSMFLEVHTRPSKEMSDPGPYMDQCYLDEIEDYLKDTYILHSIGLDGYNKTLYEQGNSFWIKKNNGITNTK